MADTYNYTITIDVTPDKKAKLSSSEITKFGKTDTNSVAISYNAGNTSGSKYMAFGYRICSEEVVQTLTDEEKKEFKKKTTKQAEEHFLSCCYSVSKLTSSKKVYKPGNVCLLLKLTGVKSTKTEMTVNTSTNLKDEEEESFSDKKSPTSTVVTEELCQILRGGYVSIKKDGIDTIVKYIISDLTIKDCNDKDEQGNAEQFVSLTINAFSPDYLLTKDKFSKVYTAKKLYQDILLPSTEAGVESPFWPNSLRGLIKFNATSTNANEKSKPYLIRVNPSRLRYSNSTTIKDANGKDVSTQKEFEYIHPYLVQYEESPFDFMVRTLNRCGEFFYYEKGAFLIGWIEPNLISSADKSPASSDIADNATKNYGLGNIYSMEKYKNDVSSVVDKKIVIDKFKSSEQAAELLAEEPIHKIAFDYTFPGGKASEEGVKAESNKTKDQRKEDEKKRKEIEEEGIPTKNSVCAVSNDENLITIPDKEGYVDLGGEVRWHKQSFNAFMGALNQPNVGAMITNLLWTDGLILAATLQGNAKLNQGYAGLNFDPDLPYIDERKETSDKNTALRPFSTGKKQIEGNTPMIFDHPFYKQNTKGIMDNEKNKLILHLGTYSYQVLLGSIIEFKGKNYIVVSISDECDAETKNCDIEAIPYDKDAPFVYPPMVNENVFFRKCKGTQRAIITDNWDPLRMNRVRIRYKWQTVQEDASPWIRIALPMASKGSGFNFTPAKGDEAIIGYENDNVEKPYIVGMVYNKDNTPPKGFSSKRDGNLSITSRNGHTMLFTDTPNGNEAWKSFMPGVSFMSKLLSFPLMAPKDPGLGKIADPETNAKFRKAVGGVTFSDSIGFYSIDMSTDKRAITIKSTLGQVTLSAFTGINISAPNGDITISGKNVKIVAGNDITMTSGTYQNPYSPKGDTHKEQTKDFFKTIGLGLLGRLQPVDMKLVRTFFDAIIRPVGGRTLIKAIGNLCMEAGSPKTIANPLGYDKDYALYNEIYTTLKKIKQCLVQFAETESFYLNSIKNALGKYAQIRRENNDIALQATGDAYDCLLEGKEVEVKDLFPNAVPLKEDHGRYVSDINDVDSYQYIKYFKDDIETRLEKHLATYPKSVQAILSVTTIKQLKCFRKRTVCILSEDQKRPGLTGDNWHFRGLKTTETFNNLLKIFLYNKLQEFLIKHKPEFKVITLHGDPTYIEQSKNKDGNTVDDSISSLWMSTERHDLSKRRKARDTIEQSWNVGNYGTEFYRQGKYTGNILYASGEQGSPTCVINKNGIERISYPTSASVIGQIKDLLNSLKEKQGE